jgi:hypothetical protein
MSEDWAKFRLPAQPELKVAEVLVVPAGEPAGRKNQEPFVIRTVRVSQQLAAIRDWSISAVYDCLLYKSFQSKGRSFPLTNKALEGWRVDRRRKAEALHKLEEIGLILVEWRFHKSPIVTVR